MAEAAPDIILLADVALDVPGSDAYTYAVADEHHDLQPGACVEVPFGRRRQVGFVLVVERRARPAFRLRTISARRAGVVVPPALLGLLRWAAKYYRCTMGEMLAAAVPAPVREGVELPPQRYVTRALIEPSGLTKRQAEVLALLPAHEPILFAEAQRLTGCSAGVLDRLCAAGALTLTTDHSIRELAFTSRCERFALSPEQQAALDIIRAALAHAADDSADGPPQPICLAGVTGSGKTLVYQEAAEQVIASGRQVLVLLPEIGLTPQLAARFRSRFQRVAVWHSGFSDGERSALWRRVAAGEIDLVIGARSALFAPLPDIGLIVVDEEHDGSYKQDSTPRYHARDLAVVYAGQLRVPVVLGSATPSLESYANVLAGRYQPAAMKTRPGGGSLPTPIVVDMAAEWATNTRRSNLSGTLVEALIDTKRRGEQTIILLNRRGWSPVVSCLSCGEAITCTSCDVSLTYHRGVEAL
ncbi:MAG: replication restart helicase PriA, partial [Planctomycetota bacterium]